nr:uncharacterized protein LOC123759357 isoform X2 [Procambarus clarkii]
MEEILAWKWDPSPSYDYLNFIRIDSFQEILAFALRSDQHSMVVVKGNEPLAHNLYHCWTIFIQNIWNAEVMVGVATESADFTDNWNQRCRIGKDEHSWALSSGGLQYNNLPHNIKLYPVVGVARRCELRLVSAHVSQPSLHLMSLVSHIIARCKARSPQLKSKMIKMPEGSSFMWHGAVSIDKSQLPPGLKKDCIMRYPWFSTDHRIKPLTRIQSQQRRRRNKHQMPKVIRLADPFEVPKLVTPQNKSSKRAIRSRKCQCGNSDKDRSCSHEKVLRFFRKRDICYLSSSDDEIFPEIAKRKKQHR